MATHLNMLEDLRDRLNDAGDSQVPKATKTRFLNRGQAAMFPKIFRTVRDTTKVLIADTYEYTLPAALAKGKLLMVELETGSATNRYVRLYRYDLVPSVTDPILIFLDNTLPAAAGARIRLTSALPLTDLAADADVYTGPDGTDELPVLYAMGLATARILDDRMDYQRYSVSNQVNGVDPSDIMTASQFWFAQFELLLDRFALPVPAAGI